MKMSIALVVPPSSESTRVSESLGPRYISSSLLQNGYNNEVLDAHAWGWNSERVVDYLIERKFKLIGVQITFCGQISLAKEIIKKVKKSIADCTIVIGGHLPTLQPDFFLDFAEGIDAVFLGEAEITFLKFVENLTRLNRKEAFIATPSIVYFDDNKSKKRNAPIATCDINWLPFPLRDTRDFEKYNLASILASRGCLYNCSFCSVPEFSKISAGCKYRPRNVQNIVQEIVILNRDHGVEFFSFIDDLFLNNSTTSRDRCLALVKLLEDSRSDIRFSIECRADSVEQQTIEMLKQVGLRRIFLGIESGSQSQLEYYNKKLSLEDSRNALELLDICQIPVCLGFMLFNPVITLIEIKKSLKFLATHGRLRGRHLNSRLIIFPGTPIRKKLNLNKDNTPYPIEYDFVSHEVQELFNIMANVSKFFNNIDTALNYAEFRIANNSLDEFNKRYLKFRSLEKQYSKLIASAIEIDSDTRFWLDSLMVKNYINQNYLLEDIQLLEKECGEI